MKRNPKWSGTFPLILLHDKASFAASMDQELCQQNRFVCTSSNLREVFGSQQLQSEQETIIHPTNRPTSKLSWFHKNYLSEQPAFVNKMFGTLQ